MLKAARAELRAAKNALQQMSEAESFEVYEDAWRQFLNCLEKCWNKAERGCQHVRDQFQPWQGRTQNLRKKDMLIRYLKQARDADNHSIQELAEHKPGGTGLGFANGSGHIKRLEIVNGEIVHYEGDPLTLTHYPSRVLVKSVLNSGKWYNPPTSHLEKPLNSADPRILGKLGLEFYERFIDEAEAKFF